MNVLFVSGGNNGLIPFIEKQSESLENRGIKITHYLIKGKGLQGYLANIIPLRKVIKMSKYEIIHAHYSLSAWVVLFAKLFLSKPLVVSFMGSDVYGFFDANGIRKKSSYFGMILSLLLQPFINGIIIKSENMSKYIIRNNYKIIPNGVDMSMFQPIEYNQALKQLKISNNKKNILFLGNPNDPRKNFKLLKDAIKKITIKENIYLLVPYPVEHDKIPLYLNAADVFVHTSYAEGSPNVIKEAMACGVPIVCTDAGDAREVISDVEGCEICAYNPENLATKIMLGINFNGKTNGRKRIMQLGLDSDTVAKKIIKQYKSIIK